MTDHRGLGEVSADRTFYYNLSRNMRDRNIGQHIDF